MSASFQRKTPPPGGSGDQSGGSGKKRSRAHAYLSSSRIGARQRVQLWCAQHMQAMISSLGQYVRAPAGHMLTTAVIGIALTLPTGFFLLLENAGQVTAGWDGTAQLSAFLEEDVRLESAARLRAALQSDPEIQAVTLIDKEQALAEYRARSGFADVIDILGENPLPHVLVIHPASAAVEPLLERIGAMPEIADIQYDQQWMERLLAILDIFKYMVLILSLMLAVAVLLIMGNTIRLSINNRKAEIEVAKLFGATDAFIRRPFLYTGFWHGFFGALLAWLLVTLALMLLKEPVRALANMYDSQFLLITLAPGHFPILLGVAVGLSLAGSWLSVHRHISDIEPA